MKSKCSSKMPMKKDDSRMATKGFGKEEKAVKAVAKESPKKKK